MFVNYNSRVGDKKRGIAQEKREAQKRLLKKVKKSDSVDVRYTFIIIYLLIINYLAYYFFIRIGLYVV